MAIPLTWICKCCASVGLGRGTFDSPNAIRDPPAQSAISIECGHTRQRGWGRCDPLEQGMSAANSATRRRQAEPPSGSVPSRRKTSGVSKGYGTYQETHERRISNDSRPAAGDAKTNRLRTTDSAPIALQMRKTFPTPGYRTRGSPDHRIVTPAVEMWHCRTFLGQFPFWHADGDETSPALLTMNFLGSCSLCR